MLNLPDAPRVLFEVPLQPVPSARFQPTGFPDIGAATYQDPDGTEMLLVESAQSMANRLEKVCYDDRLDPALDGLPHVVVDTPKGTTSSLEEAHRLNSIYIVKTDFFKGLAADLGYEPKGKGYEVKSGRPTRSTLAQVVCRADPNSVVHGVFLEKIAGVLRLPRVLSSFIEASGVRTVASGGVKNDHLDASGKESGGSAEGYGNVPYHRTEFTAKTVTAYFSVDLHLLRSYRLAAELEQLVYALCLWKIRRLLDADLRLRTACDFLVDDDKIEVRRPIGWALPSAAELDEAIRSAIGAARAAGMLGEAVHTEFTS